MPITRRQELLAWMERAEGRFLIEDDYDSEFRFSGRPVPTLQSLDTRGRVIYLNTFSKTIAPALRISYMILPQALLPIWQETMGFYSCAVPSFGSCEMIVSTGLSETTTFPCESCNSMFSAERSVIRRSLSAD